MKSQGTVGHRVVVGEVLCEPSETVFGSDIVSVINNVIVIKNHHDAFGGS